MSYKTYICVADIVVELKSKQAPESNDRSDWRYENFILKRKPKKVDIVFALNLKEDYVCYRSEVLFETTREIPSARGALAKQERKAYLKDKRQRENEILRKKKEAYLGSNLGWRISEFRRKFLLEGGTAGNFQVFFDRKFENVKVDIISSSGEWKLSDVFSGFLQLFMIYYLAFKKAGMLVHSTAIKDGANHGAGYLFSGVSGAGKSTSSRIWNEHGRDVVILNDDRIIVRKINGKFYLYSTPWHGDFSDYLKTSTERACLKKLFFIYHRKTNNAETVSAVEFFNLFYQSLFTPFWDKDNLMFVTDFVMDLIKNVDCYKFGFKNDKRIISYVRSLN